MQFTGVLPKTFTARTLESSPDRLHKKGDEPTILRIFLRIGIFFFHVGNIFRASREREREEGCSCEKKIAPFSTRKLDGRFFFFIRKCYFHSPFDYPRTNCTFFPSLKQTFRWRNVFKRLCIRAPHARSSSVFTCSVLLKRDIDFDESARQLNFAR